MRKDFVRSPLEPGNTAALLASAGDKLAGSVYYPLLQLLADVADEIARGEDIYVTFNAPRNKTALLLSVTISGQKIYLSAVDLAGLAEAARSIL